MSKFFRVLLELRDSPDPVCGNEFDCSNISSSLTSVVSVPVDVTGDGPTSLGLVTCGMGERPLVKVVWLKLAM